MKITDLDLEGSEVYETTSGLDCATDDTVIVDLDKFIDAQVYCHGLNEEEEEELREEMAKHRFETVEICLGSDGQFYAIEDGNKRSYREVWSAAPTEGKPVDEFGCYVFDESDSGAYLLGPIQYFDK